MRLWVGERAKGIDQGTAPAVSPAAEAVSLDQLDGKPQPAVGHVLGLTPTSVEAAAPSIPEWGSYDPDVAGFSALMATLDTSAIPPAGEVEENPGELLLRQQTPAVAGPVAAFEPDTPGDDWGAPRPSPAAVAVASCHVGHLAPLALWARLSESEAPSSVPAAVDRVGWLLSRREPRVALWRGGEFASGDLAAAIGRLAHPAYLALTGLPTACRIHNVRVAPIVEVSEQPEERPSWPLPSVVSLPDTISAEPPPEPAAECPEIAEAVAVAGSEETAKTIPVPVNMAEEPSGFFVHSQVADAAPLQHAVGADIVADFAGVAIEPPTLDSLPVDLMADLFTGADVADIEAVAFGGEASPPVEPEPWSIVRSAADETPAPQRIEAVFDDLAAAEPVVVEPAHDEEAGEPSRPEPLEGTDVPCAAADTVDHAVPVEGCDDPLALTVFTAAEVKSATDETPAQAPAVPPIPVPALQPASTKRRRAALALG